MKNILADYDNDGSPHGAAYLSNDSAVYVSAKWWDGTLYIFYGEDGEKPEQIYTGPKVGYPKIDITSDDRYAVIVGTVRGQHPNSGPSGIYLYNLMTKNLTLINTSYVNWKDVYIKGYDAYCVGDNGNFYMYNITQNSVKKIDMKISDDLNDCDYGEKLSICGNDGIFILYNETKTTDIRKLYYYEGRYTSTYIPELPIRSLIMDYDGRLNNGTIDSKAKTPLSCPLIADSDGDSFRDGAEEYMFLPGKDILTPNNKYALVVMGMPKTNKDYEMYLNDTKDFYYNLRDLYGFTDENIIYIAPIKKYEDGVDYTGKYIVDIDTTTKASIVYGIQLISVRSTVNDIVVILLLGHGEGYEKWVDGELMERKYTFTTESEPLTANELSFSTSNVHSQYKIFFIGCCLSGGFISPLSKRGNIILTSTGKCHPNASHFYNADKYGWIGFVNHGMKGWADVDCTIYRAFAKYDKRISYTHGNKNRLVSIDEIFYYAARGAHSDHYDGEPDISNYDDPVGSHTLLDDTQCPKIDDNGDQIGHGWDGVITDDGTWEDEGYNPYKWGKDGWMARYTYLG